jgi:hypothetical protein
MTQLQELQLTFPALALKFVELEKQSLNAKHWTSEERLAHLHKIRRAYYGDDAMNGKVEKIIRVIDTHTKEVIQTIDFR